MELPALQKGAVEAPLKRIIQRTAQEMGMSEQTVFLVLSHLCEGIAREVVMDNLVTIPAFGAFAPVSWTPKSGISPTHATPRFSPSTQFRNEVRMCCPPFPKSDKRYQTYVGNHTRRNAKIEKQTVFGEQGRIRKNVELQAKAAGIDPYDTGA